MNFASANTFTSPSIEGRIILTAVDQTAAGFGSALAALSAYQKQAQAVQIQIASTQSQTSQAQLQSLRAQQTQAQVTQRQTQAQVQQHAAQWMQQQQQFRATGQQHRQQQQMWAQQQVQQAAMNAQNLQTQRQAARQHVQNQRNIRGTGTAMAGMFSTMLASATTAFVSFETMAQRFAGIYREDVRETASRRTRLALVSDIPLGTVDRQAQVLAERNYLRNTQLAKDIQVTTARAAGGSAEKMMRDAQNLLDAAAALREPGESLEASARSLAGRVETFGARPTQMIREFAKLDPTRYAGTGGLGKQQREMQMLERKSIQDRQTYFYEQLQQIILKQGDTIAGAAAREGEVNKEFARLERALTKASELIGETFNEQVEKVVVVLADMVEWFNALDEPMRNLVTAIGSAAFAFGMWKVGGIGWRLIMNMLGTGAGGVAGRGAPAPVGPKAPLTSPMSWLGVAFRKLLPAALVYEGVTAAGRRTDELGGDGGNLNSIIKTLLPEALSFIDKMRQSSEAAVAENERRAAEQAAAAQTQAAGDLSTAAGDLSTAAQHLSDMGDAPQMAPVPFPTPYGGRPHGYNERNEPGDLRAGSPARRNRSINLWQRMMGEEGNVWGLPGLALGGPVRTGMPYMVGEGGREMFVPNADGSIKPIRAGLSIEASQGASGQAQTTAQTKQRLVQFHLTVGQATSGLQQFTDALQAATFALRAVMQGKRPDGGEGGEGEPEGGGAPGGAPSAPGEAPRAPGGIGMGGGAGAGGGAGYGPYGAPGSEYTQGRTGGSNTAASPGPAAPGGGRRAPTPPPPPPPGTAGQTYRDQPFGMGGGLAAGGGGGYGAYGKPGSEFLGRTGMSAGVAPEPGKLAGPEGFTLAGAQGQQTQEALGIGAGEWEAYRYGLASIESRGHGSGSQRYDIMGGSSGRFAGAYQMGRAEINETAQRLGEQSPSEEQFRQNPEMQERYLNAYTRSHHDYLIKNSPEYQGMTAHERMAVLGYAHNQGAGGAAKWLRTGVVGQDAFNTKGTAYGTAIQDRLAMLGTGSGTASGTAAAGGATAPSGAQMAGVVTMMNQGKTRNDPLSADTDRYLRYASMKTGLEAHVTSGGQENIPQPIDPRTGKPSKENRYGPGGAAATGTHRHDEGGAGDVKLYDPVAKRYLNMDNPADARRMEEFTKQSVIAGATGVGAGQNYMKSETVHIGGGAETSWGGADWIERARVEGMKGRLPPEQIIAELTAAGMPAEQAAAAQAVAGQPRNLNLARQLQAQSEARAGGGFKPPPTKTAISSSSLDAMGFGGPHTGPSASATWQTQRDALGVSRYDTLKAREAAMAAPSGLTTQFTGTSRASAGERGEFTHLPVGPDAPGSPGHPGNISQGNLTAMGFEAGGGDAVPAQTNVVPGSFRSADVPGGSVTSYTTSGAPGGATTLDELFPRRHGGPVSRGMPYLVGEGGPEMFMPNMGGDIFPGVMNNMRQAGRDLNPMFGPMRDPAANLTPPAPVHLGRGAVDVNLHLDRNLLGGKPSVQQPSQFDLGVNVDRTGVPFSRPGDHAFPQPLAY